MISSWIVFVFKMIFNDCSKAETEKKQPEEEPEKTPQEIYDTLLSPLLDQVMKEEIEKLQKEYFGTGPEEGQEEEHGTDNAPGENAPESSEAMAE